MRLHGLRRRQIRGERGAFLLLFALALVVILTFVAFAVDLGQARASQRSNRSTVDLAALSAGYWLAGGEFTGAQPVADAEKACVAAVDSVKTNEPSFQPAQDPAALCASLSACNSASPPASSPPPLVFTDGDMVLRIQYPVVDADLDDDRFSGPGANDGDDPCERMRITLDRTDDVAFAGVIGVTSLQTSGSVVVKGEIRDPFERAIPAFLMLERTDCGSLATAVGTGDGIEVGATTNLKGEPQPGYIHSDSNATTNCSGNTQSAYAIYGGNSQSPKSIVLEPAGGMDGIVESRAPTATGAGGYIAGTYQIGGTISRQPADDVYGVAIAYIHGQAYSTIANINYPNAATAAANGYDVYDCTGNVVAPDIPDDDDNEAYVLCPDFDLHFQLPGYREVLFAGNVGLSGGRDISLPDAVDIAIKGAVSVSGGGADQSVFDAPEVENLTVGNGIKVPNNGVFAVNRGGPAPLTTPSQAPTCPDRIAPDDTTSGNTARVVVFGSGTGPAVDVAGNLTLCEATLYLAGRHSAGNSTYTRETDDSGGECTATRPCPKGTADPGARYFFASGAAVNLVGPNETVAQVPDTGWPAPTGGGGVEDLAFWSETGGVSEVRGGAALAMTGVFSAPNGILEFRSGPASTDPTDSQYIARKLKMFAGRLNMLPRPTNTVPVPVPGTFSLIR